MLPFEESEKDAITIYENQDLRVTVERSFTDQGNLRERMTVKNLRTNDLFLKKGEFEIQQRYGLHRFVITAGEELSLGTSIYCLCKLDEMPGRKQDNFLSAL